MIYRKNYKEIFLRRGMNLKGLGTSNIKTLTRFNERGQMAIFVIVAIVLVALIAAFFFFRPQLPGVFGGAFSPNKYLEDCIEPELRPAVEILGEQGSYQDPEGFTLLDGKKIKYLCYTDDFYETCNVQQPMTKGNFEKELNLMLKGKANKCMQNLIKEYEDRGYDVKSGGINSEVSVVPGMILVTYNAPLTVSKGSTTETFRNFDVETESEMYDLLFIAQSIVEYEATLGDSATELYLQYYPDLKINKIKKTDGTTVYKLTNVITEEEFLFASRSLAWPPGYGLEEI
jgi:hypothetical protein